MEEMTPVDRVAIINAIASREGTAQQIAGWYGYTVDELRVFTAKEMEAIKLAREAYEASNEEEEDSDVVTPSQLSELWIGNKFARLKRYELVADHLMKEALRVPDATVLRELRSYMMAAANELGQLLHRGSGDAGAGDRLSVDIQGVDMESMR
jgi:predicted transcriptional regulator